ncbi:RCC1 and BTB domain-containing protein 1-like [Cloeon dipterum]|uniref:RCC1 and BTB domain-containing protein 1-like n=1 Tax=Cloeon dipterum TaxID=197152 RepID=UPI00321F941A
MAKRPTIVISTQMGKVREFAATHYFRHPCAAITEEDKVFIWGSWKNKTFMAPIPTSFSSFDDVFADASPPMTYQRFELKEFITTKVESKKKDSVIELLQKAFDKPETADVAFIVKGEKIHVHKNLLTIGSEVFKNLFLGDRKESCKNEQIIEDHSYDAFYAFLKFFYTDQVDLKPELALEVYSLAHFYQVTGLMEKCEKILKSGLTVQNAAAVYEKAILFGAEDLCEFCFEFCKKHLVYVVNSFESAETKREVVLEVFRRAANEKKK